MPSLSAAVRRPQFSTATYLQLLVVAVVVEIVADQAGAVVSQTAMGAMEVMASQMHVMARVELKSLVVYQARRQLFGAQSAWQVQGFLPTRSV